ncbi:MAG: transglutaminase-like cysteine peptidase [Lamprobacter sp.]|uniref:transglutaminase-like cysteine peptidase n=1 Tax=Lamprobacter sp. TaxID=3100796 RepID=UPI002B25E608|nr:transglutaminase-like cysteine peptidase [Lamprobacter sp.]MEA3641104.1 transglutaminase-like cysteine peptidase [Lamprobacter sp.]
MSALIEPNPCHRKRLGQAPLLATCIAAQLIIASPATAGDFDHYGIFGETGKEFNSLRGLPKWPTMLERYESEQQQLQQCRLSKANNCGYAPWQRLLSRLRGQEKAVQLREINQYVNNHPYVTDPMNWGSDDHWATPEEFFNKKAGDCEDFAIAKFLGLRALGFNNDDLRIVAVEDRKRNVNHTVTLVRLDNQIMLLDNEMDSVVPAHSVYHYKPVFAANEDAWWLFK